MLYSQKYTPSHCFFCNFAQPTHDVKTPLFLRLFNVLRLYQRPFNVVLRPNYSRHHWDEKSVRFTEVSAKKVIRSEFLLTNCRIENKKMKLKMNKLKVEIKKVFHFKQVIQLRRLEPRHLDIVLTS